MLSYLLFLFVLTQLGFNIRLAPLHSLEFFFGFSLCPPLFFLLPPSTATATNKQTRNICRAKESLAIFRLVLLEFQVTSSILARSADY